MDRVYHRSFCSKKSKDIQSKDIQQAMIITCMGVKAARLLKKLPFEEDDAKEDPNTVLQRLKDHFEGQRNVIVKRF